MTVHFLARPDKRLNMHPPQAPWRQLALHTCFSRDGSSALDSKLEALFERRLSGLEKSLSDVRKQVVSPADQQEEKQRANLERQRRAIRSSTQAISNLAADSISMTFNQQAPAVKEHCSRACLACQATFSRIHLDSAGTLRSANCKSSDSTSVTARREATLQRSHTRACSLRPAADRAST